MKSVLIIFAGSLASFAVAGNESDPVDSLKISRDVSLNEVVVTATKVSQSTPVAYSELSKKNSAGRMTDRVFPTSFPSHHP